MTVTHLYHRYQEAGWSRWGEEIPRVERESGLRRQVLQNQHSLGGEDPL